MKTEFINVTPKIAEAYLRHNKKNVALRRKVVDFYAAQMKKKQWKETAEAIQFSENGNLIDGQHRLHAIVKSGVTLRLLVARDVPRDAFHVLNTGRKRTSSDLLTIEGISNPTIKSQTTNFILTFQSGKYYKLANQQSGSSSITNAEILKFVKNNPELGEICDYCNKIYYKFRGMSPGSLSGLYWIFSKKSQRQCDDFFEKYSTGLDLTPTSPVFLLREKFIRDMGNKRKMGIKEKIALFIIAWNAFLTKKPMELLQFKTGQQFPKPL